MESGFASSRFCGDFSRLRRSRSAPGTDRSTHIKILELAGSSSEQILEFPGTVLAGVRAELGFEVPGRIVELPSTEGQIVIEGALLARLDPSDFQSKLDAELAKANAAKAEYARMQKLFDERVASEQQLETRIRNYEVMKSNVERARKALADTRLTAPFAGVVARIAVENFESVQAKQTILMLENSEIFKMTANIPERDAATLEPGLSLEERTRRTNPLITISAI